MLVVGSAAAGRAPAVCSSCLFVVIALRAVVVRCVDDLECNESLNTRPGSMSESSPLESYDIFRVFEVLGRSPGVPRFFGIYR